MEGMLGETGWVSVQGRLCHSRVELYLEGIEEPKKDFKPERDPFCIGNGGGISRLDSRMCRLAHPTVQGIQKM